MSPKVTREDDDDSLTQLLLSEALKSSAAPYRRFVQQVLELTGSALTDSRKASALGAEIEYASAVLQDQVKPRDPRQFADELYHLVTWAVETDAPANSLRAKIDALIARYA